MFGQNPRVWEPLPPDRPPETSWAAASPPKNRLLATSTTMLIARNRRIGFTSMVFRASLQMLTTNTAATMSTITPVQGCVRSMLSDKAVRITNLDVVEVLKKLRKRAGTGKDWAKA